MLKLFKSANIKRKQNCWTIYILNYILWKVFPHKNGFEHVLNKLIEEDAMQIFNAIPKKESERKRGRDNKRGMWNNQQWSHTQTTVIQICVRWRMKCRSRCERALVYYFFFSDWTMNWYNSSLYVRFFSWHKSVHSLTAPHIMLIVLTKPHQHINWWQ